MTELMLGMRRVVWQRARFRRNRSRSDVGQGRGKGRSCVPIIHLVEEHVYIFLLEEEKKKRIGSESTKTCVFMNPIVPVVVLMRH